ncbi:allophanate hydrolase [Agitococcus lubricus]|uniref:Allophanate hydrolase n=1 Tax=Agitococcus lubricus TaxID=1077255 RepID=A0A2T5IYA0_9GAMM|nr:allophanate hydrolase [Agitococcus lubricus]PTQ88961.1 allophanate hydrolase [Agitococcus lubricus]
MLTTTGWTLGEWQQAYRQGAKPTTLLMTLLETLEIMDDKAWISLVSKEALTQALISLEHRLTQAAGDFKQLPLFGIPFAVKDNIDVVGFATTCACPEFAYPASDNATVVAKLIAAGAVVMGKTNLDQFATGLVGTRSPYGVVDNSFNADFISGGSSSGSAVVVAKGLVPFALGTDTAGSGRVPAGLNNIVGLKPSCGWLSTKGVFPACRSLDCVSVFALSVDDADYVTRLAAGYDEQDPYSRPLPDAIVGALPKQITFAVPEPLQWFGDELAQQAFERTLSQLTALGVVLKKVDFQPFQQAAALLYEGAWLAERYAALESWFAKQPDTIHPVVRGIIEQAQTTSAVQAFKGQYRLAELKRTVAQIYADVDALLVPTTASIYTQEAVLADPITLNSQLGTYTNFVNLLDGCALALPAGLRADGLPFGITLIAPAWHDAQLAEFGRRWQQEAPWTTGALQKTLAHIPLTPAQPLSVPHLTLAVVGAHLTSMPLNYQLQERGAVLLEQTTTADCYQLYALAETTPPKPGLLRVESGQGSAIIVELWSMPVAHFGSFVSLIPAPLGIGTLLLADGREVKGFICEPWALAKAQNISEFGGWRAFIASKNKP